MSAFEDTRPERAPNFGGAFNAVVATAAGDLDVEVMVTIDAYGNLYQWGPCKWMPRGDSVTLPQRGDKCLVMFDDDNTPWILAWWPF